MAQPFQVVELTQRPPSSEVDAAMDCASFLAEDALERIALMPGAAAEGIALLAVCRAATTVNACVRWPE